MCPETLQPTRTDLFGGLTHSRTCRLNATLVLPSLPEYNGYCLNKAKDNSLLPLPRGMSVVCVHGVGTNKNYSIPHLVQSSDEGIGTTLSDDTIDVGDFPSASAERWSFIEIEPDWDQDRHWQQKTWENAIVRCV